MASSCLQNRDDHADLVFRASIEFAAATSELSACLLQLQKKEEIRLHKPRFRKVLDLFRSGTADEGYDEEAPDDIKGLVSGDIATRDPDAKEPTNIIHHLVRAVSSECSTCTSDYD